MYKTSSYAMDVYDICISGKCFYFILFYLFTVYIIIILFWGEISMVFCDISQPKG